MRLPDLFALLGVCIVWGLNFIVAKFAVTGAPGWVPGFEGVPPIFFAFLRFAALYAVLAPWLRPRPVDMTRMFWVAMSMGAVHFGLIFMGLQWATPSGMAIALQMGVPFATVLSVVFLKERLGVPRIMGILLALGGVLLVVANPSSTDMSIGLLFGLGAAFMGAVGMILVKRLPLDSIHMQAWIGLLSWPPLLLLSLVMEHDQLQSALDGNWLFLLALIFTVVVVNIYGHGTFYRLIQRYDATMIAPITLLAPLVGVIGGILVMGDPYGWRLFVGGGLTLAGVGIIALRQNRKLPNAALSREKAL